MNSNYSVRLWQTIMRCDNFLILFRHFFFFFFSDIIGKNIFSKLIISLYSKGSKFIWYVHDCLVTCYEEQHFSNVNMWNEPRKWYKLLYCSRAILEIISIGKHGNDIKMFEKITELNWIAPLSRVVSNCKWFTSKVCFYVDFQTHIMHRCSQVDLTIHTM